MLIVGPRVSLRIAHDVNCLGGMLGGFQLCGLGLGESESDHASTVETKWKLLETRIRETLALVKKREPLFSGLRFLSFPEKKVQNAEFD